MRTDFASLAPCVYQPACGQCYAELPGEFAILNTNTGIYFGLDPVGARVWSLILEFRSCAEIRDTLLNEYDVSSGQLEADLVTLFSDLLTKQLIELVPPESEARALEDRST